LSHTNPEENEMLTHALLSTMPVHRALISLRAEHAIKLLQIMTPKHDTDRRILDALIAAAEHVNVGHPAAADKAEREIERIEGICTLLYDAGMQWRMVDSAGSPVGPWQNFPPEAAEILAASASTVHGPVTLTSRVVAE
jgi:hypothetical protein